jgi:hypothetical protein
MQDSPFPLFPIWFCYHPLFYRNLLALLPSRTSQTCGTKPYLGRGRSAGSRSRMRKRRAAVRRVQLRDDDDGQRDGALRVAHSGDRTTSRGASLLFCVGSHIFPPSPCCKGPPKSSMGPCRVASSSWCSEAAPSIGYRSSAVIMPPPRPSFSHGSPWFFSATLGACFHVYWTLPFRLCLFSGWGSTRSRASSCPRGEERRWCCNASLTSGSHM